MLNGLLAIVETTVVGMDAIMLTKMLLGVRLLRGMLLVPLLLALVSVSVPAHAGDAQLPQGGSVTFAPTVTLTSTEGSWTIFGPTGAVVAALRNPAYPPAGWSVSTSGSR